MAFDTTPIPSQMATAPRDGRPVLITFAILNGLPGFTFPGEPVLTGEARCRWDRCNEVWVRDGMAAGFFVYPNEAVRWAEVGAVAGREAA